MEKIIKYWRANNIVESIGLVPLNLYLNYDDVDQKRNNLVRFCDH